MKEKEVKNLISKLSLYIKESFINQECYTYRGLINYLSLDYVTGMRLGLLEFNNQIVDIIESIKIKEIKKNLCLSCIHRGKTLKVCLLSYATVKKANKCKYYKRR
jgi:hypothetical protein